MPTTLIRVALAAALTLAAAPAFSDDNGRKLGLVEMLEAIDPATRAQVVDLLKQGKMGDAIRDLDASTILNEKEAAFTASMLDFEWKKRAELAARTDRTMASLEPAQRKQIVDLIIARKNVDAIRDLRAASALSDEEVRGVIVTLERRLLDAGRLKGIKRDTPPNEVMASLDPEKREQIMQFIAARKKISAIKVLRAETGLGLKDSKDIIEAVMAAQE